MRAKSSDSAAPRRNGFSGRLSGFLEDKPCPQNVPGGVDVGVRLMAAGETSEFRLGHAVQGG
jgi:hypothetical protein